MYTANGHTFVGEVVESVQSPFQLIEIVENTPFGTMMVIDGDIQVASKDHHLYHQAITAGVGYNDRILLIGGGDGYTAHRLNTYDCDTVHIEIDPEVVRLSNKYFQQDSQPLIGDGVDFVLNFYGQYYDRIIIDCHDPKGPSVPIYQPEFLHGCADALHSQGCLTLQLGAPDSEWVEPTLKSLSERFNIVGTGKIYIPSYFNDQLFAFAREPR